MSTVRPATRPREPPRGQWARRGKTRSTGRDVGKASPRSCAGRSRQRHARNLRISDIPNLSKGCEKTKGEGEDGCQSRLKKVRARPPSTRGVSNGEAVKKRKRLGRVGHRRVPPVRRTRGARDTPPRTSARLLCARVEARGPLDAAHERTVEVRNKGWANRAEAWGVRARRGDQGSDPSLKDGRRIPAKKVTAQSAQSGRAARGWRGADEQRKIRQEVAARVKSRGAGPGARTATAKETTQRQEGGPQQMAEEAREPLVPKCGRRRVRWAKTSEARSASTHWPRLVTRAPPLAPQTAPARQPFQTRLSGSIAMATQTLGETRKTAAGEQRPQPPRPRRDPSGFATKIKTGKRQAPGGGTSNGQKR